MTRHMRPGRQCRQSVFSHVLSAVLLCWMGPALAATAQGAPAAPPNIIYLLADDLGYAELGCYGQKLIKTPHIDAIRAEGIKFTQHYSGSAVCAPSRCMLMTGKHPGHAFIRDNGNPPGPKTTPFPGQYPIPDSEVTIGELLKGQGYATACIGKWGLGHTGTTGDPGNQGFDLFFGYKCQVHAHNHYPKFLWRNNEQVPLEGNDRTLYGEQHSEDLFREEALRFIRENKDRPFYLQMSFAIPHLAIQVPEESLNEYKDKIPETSHKHHGYLKHPYPHAGYAAMISHMDRDIGKIMDLVKELGLDDNTLVIFTSDNGPTYGRLGGADSAFFESAGPFRGLKGSLYEGGIRVPMVARWPGRIAPGSESDHISAFWDVLPTFCELSGATTPADTDGISFLPALTGEGTQTPHEYLYWEFPSYGGQQAVRMGDWKATRQKLMKNPDAPIELYNLRADIGETTDVAAKHPEIVEKVRGIMLNDRTPSELFPLPVVPPPVAGLGPDKKWKIVRVSSESSSNGRTADKAFDGNPKTWWHSRFQGEPATPPHELVIDLGETERIKGFRYLPRTDHGVNGMVKDYALYVSHDPSEFGTPATEGAFPDSKKEQVVTFDAVTGRYVRFEARSEMHDGPWASVAELGIMTD